MNSTCYDQTGVYFYGFRREIEEGPIYNTVWTTPIIEKRKWEDGSLIFRKEDPVIEEDVNKDEKLDLVFCPVSRSSYLYTFSSSPFYYNPSILMEQRNRTNGNILYEDYYSISGGDYLFGGVVNYGTFYVAFSFVDMYNQKVAFILRFSEYLNYEGYTRITQASVIQDLVHAIEDYAYLYIVSSEGVGKFWPGGSAIWWHYFEQDPGYYTTKGTCITADDTGVYVGLIRKNELNGISTGIVQKRRLNDGGMDGEDYYDREFNQIIMEDEPGDAMYFRNMAVTTTGYLIVSGWVTKYVGGTKYNWAQVLKIQKNTGDESGRWLTNNNWVLPGHTDLRLTGLAVHPSSDIFYVGGTVYNPGETSSWFSGARIHAKFPTRAPQPFIYYPSGGGT